MVIVSLKEGLGNQLFQYFFAKSLNCKEIAFDISFYENNSSREINLNKILNSSFPIFSGSLSQGYYIKDNFEYIEDLELEKNTNYYFDGYWHNKKYLLKAENYIKDDIFINSNVEKYLLEKYPFLFLEDCVSIHFRRSDYLNLEKYYYNLDFEYYIKALEIIGNNRKIVIFSDDIEWCKSNCPNILNLGRESISLEFINETPEIDLLAMSLCSNNIIANSTFSFWAAYLNKNTNKKVVCPKLWYKKDYSLLISNYKNEDCASDIIFPEWIRI
jgi:hypothetical protein